MEYPNKQWDEVRCAISDAVGFEFEVGELQPMNEHDLYQVIAAVERVVLERAADRIERGHGWLTAAAASALVRQGCFQTYES